MTFDALYGLITRICPRICINLAPVMQKPTYDHRIKRQRIQKLFVRIIECMDQIKRMKTEAARKRVMEAGTCRCSEVVRFKHVIQQTFDTRSFNGLKKEDRGVLILIRVYLLILREMSLHFYSLLLPITCSSDFHHAWKIFKSVS